MMYNNLQIPLFEIVLCLADAVDLISPDLSNHHKRVGYIALSIAREMGLSPEEQNNISLAGLLHDCGGLSGKERLGALLFEVDKPYQHAEIGYRLFNKFKPLAPVAQLIRYHHLPWEEAEKFQRFGLPEQVRQGSAILHLADRIAVLINPHKNILGQVKGISERIDQYAGKMFDPKSVAAFSRIAVKEYFWLETLSSTIDTLLLENANYFNVELNLEHLNGLAKLFSHIVDFRSRFTAAHSNATAVCAEALARLAGFSEYESQMIKVAGFLHDLGKFVVPEEILNKDGQLTEEERNIIRSHSYYTYRLLNKMRGFEPISSWAALHHEKLNGKGYPFHIDAKGLSLGSRIIGVADIFTALTEDRPYRERMSTKDAFQILDQMVEREELDGNLISLLRNHCDDLNKVLTDTVNESMKEYDEIWHIPLESFLKNLDSLSDAYLEMGRPL